MQVEKSLFLTSKFDPAKKKIIARFPKSETQFHAMKFEQPDQLKGSQNHPILYRS